MNIEIINFDPKYRDDFKILNEEWLNNYFVVESFDQKQLENPESEILEKGGEIFFAKDDEKIIGTASLLYNNGYYELAKMAVTETYKGKGIGNILMRHCIEAAKKLEAEKMILLSNKKLVPAISMYEKFGFREVEVDPDNPYDRCDIKMELSLR